MLRPPKGSSTCSAPLARAHAQRVVPEATRRIERLGLGRERVDLDHLGFLVEAAQRGDRERSHLERVQSFSRAILLEDSQRIGRRQRRFARPHIGQRPRDKRARRGAIADRLHDRGGTRLSTLRAARDLLGPRRDLGRSIEQTLEPLGLEPTRQQLRREACRRRDRGCAILCHAGLRFVSTSKRKPCPEPADEEDTRDHPDPRTARPRAARARLGRVHRFEAVHAHARRAARLVAGCDLEVLLAGHAPVTHQAVLQICGSRLARAATKLHRRWLAACIPFALCCFAYK